MSAELLSLKERDKLLESFVGKSMSEVVCSLPTWPLFTEIELENPEIVFYLLKYRFDHFDVEVWPPDESTGSQWPPQVDIIERPEDFLPALRLKQGEKIEPRRLDVELEPGWGLGIASKVYLTKKEEELRRYQIPMMDFDFDPNEIDEYGVLWTIKKNLRENAEMRGLILKSSGKPGHFHFLGDRLLTGRQFLTFLGACLLMEYEGRPLADSRFIGHTLTARKVDFLDLGNYDERRGPYSIYDRMRDEDWPYPDLFATLRIKPGRFGLDESRVVDVL